MTIYLGDFAAGETIYVPFHTFNSSGASVTITGLAVTDIEIYRDGGTTQRASDAGYTLLDTDGIDFDGITGIHGFSVATSDNTDAGFYAAGYDYWVVVSAITVDSQTVNFVAAIFSIENRSALRPTTAGRTLDVASTGEVGLDFANANIPVGANDALGWLENGTMQSGSTSSTAVLRSATSIVDDLIIGATVYIRSGTGAGQSRVIHDWVSATDTASVSPNWTTTPDNTSVYAVVPTPPAPTNSAALPAVNMTAISGDSTAADNCEAFFDGTGYAGTGNVIPTVTTVTTVSGLAANAITAAATAADFGTEVGTAVWATAARTLTALDEDSTTLDLDATIRAALGMASANLDTQISSVQSDTNDIQTRIPAALVSGRMDSSTGAMAANVLTAAATAADFGAEVADAVWDEALAGHAGAGSAGEALSAAGTAGDPWTTALPGAYSAGQAGYIIGQNINATVSSRASQTSLDTLDDLVDTEVAAIKAKTDQMTFGVANQLNVNVKSMNDTTVNGTGTSGDKWRGA